MFLQEMEDVLLRLTDEGRQYQADVNHLTMKTAQLFGRNDICDKLK